MTTAWQVARSLLFYAGYALIMVAQSFIGLLIAPFVPYRWLRAWLVSACWAAIWWARIACGIRFEVVGAENIPAGSCVVLAKHQSAWETLFLQAYLQPATTVAKRELLRIPFFGWGMALTRPIAIDRGKPSQALKELIRKGAEHLANGRRVIIFPEGTRMRPGEQGEYSAGGAMLAVRAAVPVVPVALNSGDCWPRGTLLKKPGLIRVQFGAPIEAANTTAKSLNEQVRDWIERTLAEPAPATASR